VDGERPDGPLERLWRSAAYMGPTPFGSCLQQALCNVLAALGLAGAAEVIGTSVGMAYRAEDGKLAGTEGRWLAGVGALTGVDIRYRRFGSATDAVAAERAALAAGAVPISSVDSFHINTPYRGREHLPHAVIVLDHADDTVAILDPTYAAQPVRLALADYLVAKDLPGHSLVCCHGHATGGSPSEAMRTLIADATDHEAADLAELAAFTSAVAAGGPADVADVAAHRMYAARLAAAAGFPALAERLDLLSRRWYMVHMVAGEMPSARVADVLRDLEARERACRAELRGAGPEPVGNAAALPTADRLVGELRRVLADRTTAPVLSCGDTADLWTLGLTSLESVRALIAVEDEFGVTLPPEAMSRSTFQSLAALAAVVVPLVRTGPQDQDGER
jgi:hypothetical protein